VTIDAGAAPRSAERLFEELLGIFLQTFFRGNVGPDDFLDAAAQPRPVSPENHERSIREVRQDSIRKSVDLLVFESHETSL